MAGTRYLFHEGSIQVNQPITLLVLLTLNFKQYIIMVCDWLNSYNEPVCGVRNRFLFGQHINKIASYFSSRAHDRNKKAVLKIFFFLLKKHEKTRIVSSLTLIWKKEKEQKGINKCPIPVVSIYQIYEEHNAFWKNVLIKKAFNYKITFSMAYMTWEWHMDPSTCLSL